MTKVKVFLLSGDPDGEALAAEVARVPSCITEVYTCPSSLGNMQPMPFIQVDGGERFYGKEGIQTFLGEMASAR